MNIEAYDSFGSSRWERLFEAVHELSVLISAGPHREDHILERILRSTQMLLDARFVHLFLVEGRSIRRFVLSHDEDGKEILSVQTLPHSPNLVQWIQQEQAESLTRRRLHGGGEGEFRDEAENGGPISAPLHARSRSHGVLIAFPRCESYGDEDFKLLSYLANQAAVALEHAELYRKLEQEATTDGLTGLYNYRYFMDALGREIRRAERFEEPFAVIMVDVDNLKQYNDLYGHLGGSAALEEMARILRSAAREIDIAAKYGGDEFSLILPNTRLDGAVSYAQRLIEQVGKHAFQGDPERRLTISAGVALFPDDARSPKGLLASADARLYLAKSLGKNRIGAHDDPPGRPDGIPLPDEELTR